MDLDEDGIFSSVDSVQDAWYSPSLGARPLDAFLGANTAHFVHVYGIRSSTGEPLNSPTLAYFTTGPRFPPYSVSGVVQSGSTGHHPGGYMVILSPRPLGNDEPETIMGTVANSSGAFTTPYLNSGTYSPIAVKHANGDGLIRPRRGPITAGDSGIVAGSSVTGVVLDFASFPALEMTDGWANAAPFADAELPSDKVLQLVTSYQADTTGHAWSWVFSYTSPSESRAWVAATAPLGVILEGKEGGGLRVDERVQAEAISRRSSTLHGLRRQRRCYRRSSLPHQRPGLSGIRDSPNHRRRVPTWIRRPGPRSRSLSPRQAWYGWK